MNSPTTLEFLLVSSEYPTLKAVTAGLQKCGASLDCLTSADSARDYISRRRLDGVILDLEVASALDLIATIRQGTSNRYAVVFACAGDRLQSADALRAGANVVLHKPLTTENIVSNISAAQELMKRERRRYFRHEVTVPVVLTGSGKEQRAMMTNISEGGMAVHSTKTMKCPSLVDFSFQLPLGPALAGKGRIAWVNSEGGIGIEFQFLRGKGKNELITWCAHRERINTPSMA